MDPLESPSVSKVLDDNAIAAAVKCGLTEKEARELVLAENTNMKKGLLGWKLIEGRIDNYVTPGPKISEVIAALEAIRCDQIDPFVILQVPQTGEVFPGFCQAWAGEDGYVCEIRIYQGKEFCQMRAFQPDSEGRIWDDPETGEQYGEDPDMNQTIRVFTAFIANQNAFPTVDDLEWWDISGQFEPVE